MSSLIVVLLKKFGPRVIEGFVLRNTGLCFLFETMLSPPTVCPGSLGLFLIQGGPYITANLHLLKWTWNMCLCRWSTEWRWYMKRSVVSYFLDIQDYQCIDYKLIKIIAISSGLQIRIPVLGRIRISYLSYFEFESV